ncbi:MAG: soluble lytic murein transglycosylase [Myxococcota bacterium]|jgi:soluble lytic murein transglycosylase
MDPRLRDYIGCKIFFCCKNKHLNLVIIYLQNITVLLRRLIVKNNFFVIFLFLFFYCDNSFAVQMSQRLWGGLTKDDVSNLKKLSKSIKKNDYRESLLISKKMRGNSAFADAAFKISLWKKYSQIDKNNVSPKKIEFSDISRFVSDNRFFPNLSELRKNVEKVAIANKIPYSISKKYFKKLPATNFESKIYLLGSQINHASKQKNNPGISQDKIEKEIQDMESDIWINENFSEKEESEFLTKYSNQLTQENHISRVNRLLWDNKNSDARRIFYLIDEDNQKLFKAIIAIAKNPKYINRIITNIPRRLRSNELLAYTATMWKKESIKNNDVDDMVDILLKIPANVSRPEKWWPLRKLYGRELLKSKDYKDAYKIISNHGLKSGSAFADAQWTMGWVALRFLKKPELAYQHFHKLYLNVRYPISVSRAAYWLGMSSVAMENEEKAIEWYRTAAKYPIYFYGQLAIHKHRVLDSIDAQNDIILPKDPPISKSDIKYLAEQDELKIAYLMALMGNISHATQIFEYAVANAQTEGQIVAIMKVSNEIKNPEMALKVSKAAAKKNVFLIKDKFQIIDGMQKDPHSPLVHAIIKQESGFAPSALSRVGAVGFMQLMPGTAKIVSNKIGKKYSRRKLARNMKYNIALGSFYIKSLIEDFEGSELLAIASYNAGPSNARRWVKEFYDPRKTRDIDKVVDWIELITYSETRNYVQRIMENLIVYKYLMSRTEYDELK